MKPAVKKILLGSAVAISVLSFLAYRKIKQLQEIFSLIEITPVDFRNLKISTKTIEFDLDIKFTNPTGENFNVKGYVATLQRLNFFYSGIYIGTANKVFNELSVPANNQLIVKNIPVVLPTTTILQNATNLIDFDFNKLQVQAVVSIGSTEYYIN
jgi:hypothetical protein